MSLNVAYDANPSRLGFKNGTGNDDVMFLQLYGGEVLGAYGEKTIMQGLHRTMTISNGSSYKFPVTWKTKAHYHEPGKLITGTQQIVSEQIIDLDDKLIADTFIPDIDEAKNHYDIRSPFSMADGKALARTYDQNVLIMGAKAAAADHPHKDAVAAGITGANKVHTMTGYAALTDAKAKIEMFVDTLFQRKVWMEEHDLPAEDYNLFIKPEMYYELRNHPKVFNRDFGENTGNFVKGILPLEVAGFNVYTTNYLASTNITATNFPAANATTDTWGNTLGPVTSGAPKAKTKYIGDFSKHVALLMAPDAVATVQLMGLRVEGKYQMERQGTLMISSIAVGHGILDPSLALSIKTD